MAGTGQGSKREATDYLIQEINNFNPLYLRLAEPEIVMICRAILLAARAETHEPVCHVPPSQSQCRTHIPAINKHHASLVHLRTLLENLELNQATGLRGVSLTKRSAEQPVLSHDEKITVDQGIEYDDA
ncbi:unnamed protein product [Zymoseptoria tritici ST99CH_3D1]|nr:unnamed protein product [Zymoseptoria tritici ST99CH_3D1]